MSTVIKAADLNTDRRGVVFNFDDMTNKADQYLQKVRAEAVQIVTKAKQDALTIRKKAELDGRRDGQRQVEEIVENQLAEKLQTLLPALQQAIGEIRDAKQAWLTHWENSGVHVATAIAERIIRREVSKTPEITLTLLREALELAAGSSQLRIQMNPSDCETLGNQVKTLIAEFSSLGSTELVPAAKISPGGCLIETRMGTIDQRLESQLARIEEELT